MTWWMWALFGALLWGVHYPLIGKALSAGTSPVTIYFLPNVLLMITLPFWYKILIDDYYKIMAAEWSVKLSTGIIMFTSIIATVAVYKAIHSSNATLASLIEISYPLFVAIGAYVLFQENHLNWPTAFGGLLVLIGTGIVIYANH